MHQSFWRVYRLNVYTFMRETRTFSVACLSRSPTVRRLVLLLPRALESLRSVIDPEVAHIALPRGQEVALPDFSPIAVDEALTNALVHRDYSRPDRVVVDHSPNALRVWSPDGLPFGVTADRLLSTVSTPRPQSTA